jgi:Mycobacterium 19 kDa lipoprotein antigen
VHRSAVLLVSVASVLCAAGCSSLAPVAEGVSLTIGGKKQAIRGSVSCSSHSAGDAVKVGKMPGGLYIHIAPGLGGVSTTEELDLGDSTGKPLVGADTTVTLQQERTYHITGNAVPQDEQDTSAPEPFELNVRCP